MGCYNDHPNNYLLCQPFGSLWMILLRGQIVRSLYLFLSEFWLHTQTGTKENRLERRNIREKERRNGRRLRCRSIYTSLWTTLIVSCPKVQESVRELSDHRTPPSVYMVDLYWQTKQHVHRVQNELYLMSRFSCNITMMITKGMVSFV